MRSGQALWNEHVGRYDLGVEQVRSMRRTWESLRGRLDDERFAEVDAFLAIQEQEAQWWRNASVAYFQSVSGRPLPAGTQAPEHTLDYYKGLSFPYVPGH
jgi:alpha-glucuronidase